MRIPPTSAVCEAARSRSDTVHLRIAQSRTALPDKVFLLLDSAGALADATVGGHPVAPSATTWPHCSACNGPMQFLAQFPLQNVFPECVDWNSTVLLFQCQNRPGMCDEWAPDSGGNAALLVSLSGSGRLEAPPGRTLLKSSTSLMFEEYDEAETDDAAEAQCTKSLAARFDQVIGKARGKPLWLQGDETPLCRCGQKMTFLAQLEERGGGGMNFGGGRAYAFVCSRCRASAKFLWQC